MFEMLIRLYQKPAWRECSRLPRFDVGWIIELVVVCSGVARWKAAGLYVRNGGGWSDRGSGVEMRVGDREVEGKGAKAAMDDF